MVISFFHLVDVIARLVVVKRGFTCLNNEPVFFAHFLLKFFVCHTFWQITFKDLLTLFVLSDRKKMLAQANADSRNNLVYIFLRSEHLCMVCFHFVWLTMLLVQCGFVFTNFRP